MQTNHTSLEKLLKHAKIVLLNISRCYNAKAGEEKIYVRSDLYEMTRKYWRADLKKITQADYVCGVANGHIVTVYKHCIWRRVPFNDTTRLEFESPYPVNDSPLLGFEVEKIITPGQSPIRYINF